MGFFLLSFVIIIADDFVLLNKHYYKDYFQDVFFVVPLLLKPHNEWISNKESKGGVMYRLPPTLSTNKKSIG